METTMSSLAADGKAKRRAWIKGAAAMLLGLGIVGFFFLPQMLFVFRDMGYTVTGWDLTFAQGFWIENAEGGVLVGIPWLPRAASIAGPALALCGIVLLLFRRTTLAAIAYVLSGISPLVLLVSSASIQTAVASQNISEISVGYYLPFFYTLLAGIAGAVLSLWIQGGEKLAQSIFLVASCVSIGAVLVITVYIIVAGAPALAEIGVFQFLFGTTWDVASEQFGILALILSSLAGTAGAIVLGVPIGVLTAVFLSELASPKVSRWIRPAIELLAGIPSVIYGFVGMLVVVPAIRAVFPGSIGDSLLAAMIILAIMVIPTIVNVTENALRAVPPSYREASLGLGATPIRTIFSITIPAARSGILSGVILGVGRAIGETMAVIMVAGNVANMPSLLGSVRFLTTGIAMEMSYASGLHRQALFAIGLVLFIFIMIVNLSFTLISRRGAKFHAG